MAQQIRSYPQYKFSNKPWLGNIPDHWDILPNRCLFNEIVDQNHFEEPLLSVTISRGVIKQIDLLSSTSKKDNSNLDKAKYKLVELGDIVYNKMRAWQGAIGVSNYRGIVSPAYVVVRLRGKYNPRFFHYLFRTPAFTKEAERWSYGITSDQWSLRSEHFKLIYSCVPPLIEQNAIVHFLDHTDHLIRRYIRAKQKELKLLNEQKQVIIYQAVTRGLDPNVKLKSSGVELLGDMPEHWKNYKLKSVAHIQTGLTLGKRYEDQELVERPYLRVANVQNGYLDLSDIKYIKIPLQEAQRSLLLDGDVLMTEGGDIDKLGRGAIWNGHIPNCLHQNHIFAIRTNTGILLPEYIVALMQSIYGRVYFQVTAKKTTNLASTNSSTIMNFPICIPDVNEQKAILNYLSQKISLIDQTIDNIRNQISHIRDYQNRLIADVVTGKIDVQAVDIQLSEEVDTIEPIEDEFSEEENLEEPVLKTEDEG